MVEFIEGEFGTGIIEFFQSGKAGTIFWYLLMPFHYLGSETGYLIVMPVLYWSVNKKLGKYLFLIVLIGTSFTNIFKGWLKTPRPFHILPETIVPIERTLEYGLPSGHTTFGTVFGLTLYRFYKKPVSRFVVVLFIVLMGISRMVHGMHFLQDVITGWILGSILFYLFFRLEKPVIQFINSNSTFVNVIIIGGAVMFLYFFTLLYTDSEEIQKSLLSPLGGFTGGIIGFFIESKKIRFQDTSRLKTNILRAAIGLILMFIMYLLLEKTYYGILNEKYSMFFAFLYLLRYMVLGFWITAGIPFLFQSLKLS